jgi:hypothetical protein
MLETTQSQVGSLSVEPTDWLAWLADAPLFVDSEQIGAFYDAVVRPENTTGKITLQLNNATANKISGKVAGEVGFSLGKIFPYLGLPDLQAKVSTEGAGERTKSSQETETIEIHPISTPQRQLVQMALHYAVNLNERLFVIDGLQDAIWRAPETILALPRALVFINLPSLAEAKEKRIVETKLIPMAAEFSDGEVVLIHKNLLSGDGRTVPPAHPDFKPSKSADIIHAERQEYWRWFSTNFSPETSMLAVEEASKGRGKMRWIAYRIPINEEGDTLHLHISTAGRYDTGSFAYNFISRGYAHGIRLVGSLKSGPDMNVLAIFER